MVSRAERPTTLLGLGTALPQHPLTAERAREILVELFPRVRPVTLPPVNRYTVTPLEPRGRALGDAMEAYRTYAPELAVQAARSALDEAGVDALEIDTVITTSCTGYLVPALDIDLIARLGLREDVRRIPSTEHGCTAGLAALGVAHQQLQAKGD